MRPARTTPLEAPKEHRLSCRCVTCVAEQEAEYEASRQATDAERAARRSIPRSYCPTCGLRVGHWAGCPNA